MSSQTQPHLHAAARSTGRPHHEEGQASTDPAWLTGALDAPADAAATMTVDTVLDEFFRGALERSGDYGRDYTTLWDGLRSAAQGGKRFRPALLTGMYRRLGGTDDTLASTAAAAVELLHTAFVVHDDVIDHDDVRRGTLNVSGSFTHAARAGGSDEHRARTLGVAAGILAGDLALTGALRLVAASTAEPQVRADLLDLLDHAMYVTAAGELADVRYSLDQGAPSLADLVTMAAHKTAVYSFELPLQAGAVLAGADRPTVEALGRLGRLVGIAFQLHDDLDGVFGDEAVTGKSALTDLREGKMPPLVAHARETEQWASVEEHFGSPDLTLEQVDHVRAVLEGCGSRAFIEELAAEHLTSARHIAAGIDLPPDAVAWLEAMTRSLPWRSR